VRHTRTVPAPHAKTAGYNRFPHLVLDAFYHHAHMHYEEHPFPPRYAAAFHTRSAACPSACPPLLQAGKHLFAFFLCTDLCLLVLGVNSPSTGLLRAATMRHEDRTSTTLFSTYLISNRTSTTQFRHGVTRTFTFTLPLGCFTHTHFAVTRLFPRTHLHTHTHVTQVHSHTHTHTHYTWFAQFLLLSFLPFSTRCCVTTYLRS